MHRCAHVPVPDVLQPLQKPGSGAAWLLISEDESAWIVMQWGVALAQQEVADARIIAVAQPPWVHPHRRGNIVDRLVVAASGHNKGHVVLHFATQVEVELLSSSLDMGIKGIHPHSLCKPTSIQAGSYYVTRSIASSATTRTKRIGQRTTAECKGMAA